MQHDGCGDTTNLHFGAAQSAAKSAQLAASMTLVHIGQSFLIAIKKREGEGLDGREGRRSSNMDRGMRARFAVLCSVGGSLYP